MGKSSKKSKHINIGNDFKKQKLKAGKKKASATATITTFKSKSIYINEQLKTQVENELLSYTKHSLPELLSHLNHYSANFRFRAMVGIKEILGQRSSKVAEINLGSIVQKISKSVMDDDSEVRRTCISLLQLIFDELSEKKMSPHFPLILSHLYCAMSHISVKVQKDSLKVVELLMKYYPNLIRFYAGTKLLQYFLELISVKESGINSTGRILATTFALKKETAIQWRLRVLSLILSLLKILSQPSASVSRDQTEQMYFWSTENLASKLIPTSLKLRRLTLENMQRNTVVTSDGPSTDELMETTFPLLLQCWIEVSASSVFEKDVETVQTMLCVLSITYSFCKERSSDSVTEYEKSVCLREKYHSYFVKHFFKNFPFEAPEVDRDVKDSKRRKSTKIKVEIAKQSEFDHINLLVCNLCSLITASRYFEEDSERIEATIEYLTDYLETCITSPFVDSQYINLVICCLERLFRLQIVRANGDSVLCNLYKFCCSPKCARLNRGKVMQFMMGLYENYSSLRENACFEKLLGDLPGNFASVLNEFGSRPWTTCKLKQKDATDYLSAGDSSLEHLSSLLRCMQCAFRRKDSFLLQSLSKFLNEIVSAMTVNHVALFCPAKLNCIKCIQFQNSIFACLLPQLASMPESNFVILSNLCCNSLVHMRCRTFVIDVLLLKVLPNDDSSFTRLNKTEVCSFLKFLFTVLLITNKKGARMTDAFSHHEVLCNHICNSLKQLTEFWPDLWHVQKALFEKKLKVASTSSKNETILGLLKIGCNLANQSHVEISKSSSDFHGMGRFLAAFSLLCAKQSREWEDSIRSCIVNLLSVSKIMNSYMRVLVKTDSCISVLSLIKLLEITELQESYKAFSSDITNYVSELEKSENTATADLRKLKSLSSALCTML